MTYPYRAYGLTLGCDTPVSALRQERTEPERFDIAVSLGPETDWVREARRLPSRLEHPRPGEVERDNSPFTLTSFKPTEAEHSCSRRSNLGIISCLFAGLVTCPTLANETQSRDESIHSVFG